LWHAHVFAFASNIPGHILNYNKCDIKSCFPQ
jgi:hypothetical protein